MAEQTERCYFMCGELADTDTFNRIGKPVRACARCARLHGGIEGVQTFSEQGDFMRRWYSNAPRPLYRRWR